MARASIWLDKFNRDAEFVATKPIRVNGVDLRPGDPLDKTALSTRTLRVMYDSRKIKVSPSADDDDRTALLDQYRERFGKRPFGGWDNAELKRRLTDATP